MGGYWPRWGFSGRVGRLVALREAMTVLFYFRGFLHRNWSVFVGGAGVEPLNEDEKLRTDSLFWWPNNELMRAVLVLVTL